MGVLEDLLGEVAAVRAEVSALRIAQEHRITEWLTTREAAEHLGMTEDAVRHRVQRGEIPFSRVGSMLRFERAALDAWLRGGA